MGYEFIALLILCSVGAIISYILFAGFWMVTSMAFDSVTEPRLGELGTAFCFSMVGAFFEAVVMLPFVEDLAKYKLGLWLLAATAVLTIFYSVVGVCFLRLRQRQS